MQAGFEGKLADHKELIESKFAPAIALVKVLQITDSKAFVTAYGSLLEARWQNADAMQQALALLDVTKDVAVTRLNMFRAAAAGGVGLTVCSWFVFLSKSAHDSCCMSLKCMYVRMYDVDILKHMIVS